MTRVGVLGAGIAGLAAALRARDLARERGIDLDVTIYERADRIGGCIETYRGDGFTLELGPDSMLIDKPAGVELLRRLGLEEHVLAMRPEFRGSRIVRGRHLVPIPDDFRLFTPTSMLSLAKSGLLGAGGVLRAAMEPLVPPRRGTGDESIAAFVSRRFGREVFDRIAQPLVGGIFGGDPARVSTAATLPYMQEAERNHGSLVRGMQAARKTARASGASVKPRLVSLRLGLAELTDALQRELAGCIRTNAGVRSVERTNGAWNLTLADGSRAACDVLICALPAYEAARLVANLDTRMADRLQSIRYHGVATITLAFPTNEMPALPRATGFVVPQIENRKIMALTFTTQKYEGRAPQGTTVVRAFAGGAFEPRLAAAPNDELIGIVRDELADLLDVGADPSLALVRRWPNALPEYAVGHRDLVALIRADAARIGALALAGNAYDGAGIPDCIRTGFAAAESIVASATS